MASSPAIVVCTVCHMYSFYLSLLELEIETRIQPFVEDSKNARAVDMVLDCSVPAFRRKQT